MPPSSFYFKDPESNALWVSAVSGLSDRLFLGHDFRSPGGHGIGADRRAGEPRTGGAKPDDRHQNQQPDKVTIENIVGRTRTDKDERGADQYGNKGKRFGEDSEPEGPKLRPGFAFG